MYTSILCQYLMFVCVGMFIQEFWPLLRLLILLTLIWWQVSNLSKISRIVLPWIQRAIDSHFGWNHWSIICHFGWSHWSIICLSKVSSCVSNVSKEWIWYAKSGISGPGVWSISRKCAGWSASLLFAYGINRFSHDVAKIWAGQCDNSTAKVQSQSQLLN